MVEVVPVDGHMRAAAVPALQVAHIVTTGAVLRPVAHVLDDRVAREAVGPSAAAEGEQALGQIDLGAVAPAVEDTGCMEIESGFLFETGRG